jgi:hypothetical protein
MKKPEAKNLVTLSLYMNGPPWVELIQHKPKGITSIIWIISYLTKLEHE